MKFTAVRSFVFGTALADVFNEQGGPFEVSECS